MWFSGRVRSILATQQNQITTREIWNIPSLSVNFYSSVIFLTAERCAVLCLVTQSCFWLFGTPWTVALQAPLSLEILQKRILECVVMPSSRGSSQHRDCTHVSHMAAGFFTIWARGKPKDTGVGSLSLLKGIFLTHVSDQGFLHCKQILYQLTFPGKPWKGVLETHKYSWWEKHHNVRNLPTLRFTEVE